MITFLSLLTCFNACSTSSGASKLGKEEVSSEIYEGFKKAHVNDVLILPVLLRSNPDGVLIDPERVLGRPDRSITNMLVSAFELNTDLSIQDLKGDEYWALLPDTGITKETLFKKATEISKSEKSPYVIFAVVDDKDARTGGGYGSQRSSSVSYRIWLYDSFTDKIIWSSAYQSNEESLTSNLFEFGQKLESGIGFKTSEELTRSAFKASAQSLKKDLSKASRIDK